MDDGHRHAGDDARRRPGRRLLARSRGRHVANATRSAPAIVAALLMAGATTVVYGLVVPPFEPPDELAHLQYARFVATTGTLPSAVPPPRLGVARRRVRVRAATALLRRRGSRVASRRPRVAGTGTRARPAIAHEARRHRADDLPARGVARARGGTPGAPPAATRVAAHGDRHDVADRKAARDGDVRPARHRDSRWRSRIDSAMVRGDGSGLDRSAGDVAGRRGNARHRQGRSRPVARDVAALHGRADRRGVCSQGDRRSSSCRWPCSRACSTRPHARASAVAGVARRTGPRAEVRSAAGLADRTGHRVGGRVDSRPRLARVR